MRRMLTILLTIALILVSVVPAFAQTVNTSVTYDLEQLDSGLLTVSSVSTSGKKIKLMIQKGTIIYTYNLSADGTEESFPLQSGSGKYTFSVLENTKGSSYRLLSRKNADVKITDEKTVYLHSIQNIRWNESMDAIKKAAELTEDKTNALGKVQAIYDYIVENIRYDRPKLQNMQNGYLPDIEDTFLTNKGICYDYAALFAAMLRSAGIPVKLVTGWNSLVSGYHSWNEVYLEETGEWVRIDTTADAKLRNYGKVQMIKRNLTATVKFTY